MKKLLTSLTAVSVLGTSVLFGGFTAHAEGDEIEPAPQLSVTTPGEITFIPDDSPITVDPPVEEGPDVDIPTLPGPGLNTGPLTIAYAPTLNFGQQIVSLESQSYPMIAEMQPLRNSEDEEVPYVSFVQVQDRRGTNDGWNLYVTASEFESDRLNHSILAGAEIRFFNSALEYSGNNEYAPVITGREPVQGVNNETIEGVIRLTPDQSTIILAAADGKGAGISSLMWGNQAQLTTDHENGITEVLNHDIQLFVPGTSVQNAATYEANLHWQLVAGHDNILPEGD